LREAWLVRYWPPLPSVVAAGVLSSYYFGLTGTFWAVTGEFTRWGGHVLQWFGVPVENWGYFKLIHLEGTPLDRVDGVMILGMFAGCLCAALWADNLRLRQPAHRIRIVQAVVGGIIAGFGARLAMGCNLAAFFTGIPQFSLHAWFFALATAAGTYLGARVSLLPVFRVPVRLAPGAAPRGVVRSPAQVARRLRLGLLLFGVFCALAVAKSFVAPKLGLAALCGIGFGLIIERAQICFTSAFRDLWLTGRSTMTRAILAGMAVSAIGVFSYVQLGVAPKIFWAGPNAVLGGLLFGFGIVLAGGCETGWMYRAVEGQVHYWWVGLGNIVGATLLAASWDTLGPALATGYDKINLLVVFGPVGGLLATYLLLACALAAVVWWERRYFRRHAGGQGAQDAAATLATDESAS